MSLESEAKRLAALSLELVAVSSGAVAKIAELEREVESLKAQLAEAKHHGQLDYDAMRKFQSLYITADHQLRAAQRIPGLPEVQKLQAFAQAIMEHWPEFGCELDGFELQELAAEHGLIVEKVMDDSCGENCQCASLGATFPTKCWRKTSLFGWPPTTGEAARQTCAERLETIPYSSDHLFQGGLRGEPMGNGL